MFMKQLITNKTSAEVPQSNKQQRKNFCYNDINMNKTELEQSQALQSITKQIVSEYSTLLSEQISQGYVA